MPDNVFGDMDFSDYPDQYDIKQYTLEQHTISEDLKQKLKKMGIVITKDAYGRLKFEANEYTISMVESFYNLKFREVKIVP